MALRNEDEETVGSHRQRALDALENADRHGENLTAGRYWLGVAQVEATLALSTPDETVEYGGTLIVDGPTMDERR
jgi:hypothetical protein